MGLCYYCETNCGSTECTAPTYYKKIDIKAEAIRKIMKQPYF